jgi:hypothetical protein
MHFLLTLTCTILMWLPVYPALTAMPPAYRAVEQQPLYDDLIFDFQVFTRLLADTIEEEQGLYLRSAKDIDQAVRILSTAFAPELAFELANYYLSWDPRRELLWVTAMESIPIVTAADLPGCAVIFTGQQAIVSCLFADVYQLGDHLAYQITLEKPFDHWVIVDLKLDTP